MKKAILIDMVAGISRVRQVDFTKEGDGLGFFYKNLGCECIDIVAPYGLEVPGLKGISMVVDDEALLKENPVANPVASLAYGYMKHGQPICGTVMLCKDEYTPEGIETGGFTEEEADKVVAAIGDLVMKFNKFNKK